jgi:hypothetical protein
MHWGPDALGVALSFAGAGFNRDELAGLLRARREALAILADQLAAKRRHLVAAGYIDAFTAATIYRSQLLAETEVRWHDEFAKILADLPADGQTRDST